MLLKKKDDLIHGRVLSLGLRQHINKLHNLHGSKEQMSTYLALDWMDRYVNRLTD